MNRQLTAIIADDEAPLREHLQRLLNKLWPALKICGLAENGRQALDMIKEHQPDIVFLDIRMPGISGMDVAKRVAGSTHIVFVTAFDQYAVDAFSHHAIDYLLKPVSKTRLNETVTRLKNIAQLSSEKPQDLQQLFQQLEQHIVKPKASLQWLKIMQGNATQLLHVDDVVYFKFEDKYTSVRTKTATQLIRTSLKELEETLNPEYFWRIHRNTIVNVRYIESAIDHHNGLTLKLKGIPDELSVSRANKQLFKHM
jgi:DNA-binding LytR/AlgR family response regulator